jgi:hypothetical protein
MEVNPSVPTTTVPEFIGYAKARADTCRRGIDISVRLKLIRTRGKQ